MHPRSRYPLRRRPTSTTAPFKTSRRAGHCTEVNITSNGARRLLLLELFQVCCARLASHQPQAGNRMLTAARLRLRLGNRGYFG